tara:strand:- start:721 stop:930 length:210 start_codon:yes stop_codon:yes gene_type:complete
MTESIFKELFIQAKNQGLSFILMMLISYFFYTELSSVKEDLKTCQDERIEILERFLITSQKNITDYGKD